VRGAHVVRVNGRWREVYCGDGARRVHAHCHAQRSTEVDTHVVPTIHIDVDSRVARVVFGRVIDRVAPVARFRMQRRIFAEEVERHAAEACDRLMPMRAGNQNPNVAKGWWH
jgi:hypothetical protein